MADQTFKNITRDALSALPPEHKFLISDARPLPEILRVEASPTPQMDLYHFVFSVCSQKVRLTLAEKKAHYGSNELVILPPASQNYHPTYVRMRLLSEVAKSGQFASGYTGVTSVKTEGFDALVVPTLVDNSNRKVIVDSRKICLYICAQIQTGTDLIPKDLKTDILAQLDIVDQTPHAALLYGANPKGDHRPPVMQHDMPGIHARKIEIIKRNLALVGDEETVVKEAYESKIAKETAAASFVADAGRMNAAISLAEKLVGQLDAHLNTVSGDWVLGDSFTLADVAWAVSLIRMDWLGYGEIFWKDNNHRPHVAAYVDRLKNRDTVRATLVDWPGHPPSN